MLHNAVVKVIFSKHKAVTQNQD